MTALISSTDFTIGTDGEGYISQRRTEKLLGLASKSVNRWIKNPEKCRTPKLNENNQLHEETFVMCCTYYAENGNIQAIQLLGKFALAGARAFIYSAAGYTPTPPSPAISEVLSKHMLTEQWVAQI